MLIGILWFFLMVCGIDMIATRSTHSDRSRVFFGAFALISSYALLQKMFFIFKGVDMQDYYYVLPLRELFFDAGYRSRASAWRNFTAIVGCSPSEFEERAEKCADKLIAHHR